MLNYEKFEEAWNDLERRDKIALFNEYACEYCPDDQIYNFDEDFFETYFSGNPMDAVRAANKALVRLPAGMMNISGSTAMETLYQ